MGRLGAHMSIAGGLYKAIERGDELECESIQIFVVNGRTWKTPPLTDEDTRAFRRAADAAKKVRHTVAHNSYLINISTANAEARARSVKYFIDIFERCEALGIEGLITHPGSHLGAGEEEGLRLTADTLNQVLAACPGFKSCILLENTAGQGDCVGHSFEHLARIASETRDPDAIGFCFDTEHAFAAGYDLRTAEAYAATLSAWDEAIGLKKIRAFHLNDSVKELGCRVDRHANIGEGFLGAEAFRPLVTDARFAAVPMCLETAPGEDNVNWKRELRLLREMASGATHKFTSAQNMERGFK